MAAEKKRKQPTIKTFEDKGTKMDFVDFGDGNKTFIYQSEKIRNVTLGIFKFNWGSKYNVISPQELSHEILGKISADASRISGSMIKPEDLIVHSSKADLPSSFTVGNKPKPELKKKK